MIFRLNVYPTFMFIRKNYSAMQQCNLDYLQVEECDNATISEDFGRDRHVSFFPYLIEYFDQIMYFTFSLIG